MLDFKPRRRLLPAGPSTASAARRLGGDHRPSTIDHWPSTGGRPTAGERLLGWYSGAATGGGGGSAAAALRYRPQRATAPTKCIAKLSSAKGGGAASRPSALMAGNMEPHAAGTAMSAAVGPGCSCGRTGSRMSEVRRHGPTIGCQQLRAAFGDRSERKVRACKKSDKACAALCLLLHPQVRREFHRVRKAVSDARHDGLRRQHLSARRPHRSTRGGGRAERSPSVWRPEDVSVRQRQAEAE